MEAAFPEVQESVISQEQYYPCLMDDAGDISRRVGPAMSFEEAIQYLKQHHSSAWQEARAGAQLVSHPFFTVADSTPALSPKELPASVKTLTKVQEEVLRLLGEGWELGVRTGGPCAGCWLQQGGVGRGGVRKSLRRATFLALLEAERLVLLGEATPLKRYGLAK